MCTLCYFDGTRRFQRELREDTPMAACPDVAEGAPDLVGLLLVASGLLEDTRFFVELAQLFERRGWSFTVGETCQRACGPRLVYATALIDAADGSHQSEGEHHRPGADALHRPPLAYVGVELAWSVEPRGAMRCSASTSRSGPTSSANARSAFGSASHSQATRSQNPASTAER